MNATPEGVQAPAPPIAPRALCLSGGGYRAALFHLGVVTRLNEIGALGKFDTISSVSGGSILSAFLVRHIPGWPAEGEIVPDWDTAVVAPFLKATAVDVRTGPFLKSFVRPWRNDAAVRALAKKYARVFELGEMPLVDHSGARPRMILNATDMQFGLDWIFDTGLPGMHARCGDYFAGHCDVPADWPLNLAVAASSCFPPVFNPLRIGHDIGGRLQGGAFGMGAPPAPGHPALHAIPPSGETDPARLRRELSLSDGGVYDNLGVHAVWDDNKTVLSSDGGGVFGRARDRGLLSRLKRYQAIAGHGGSLVRRQWLIERLENKQLAGAYLGIGSSPLNFPVHSLNYPQALIDDFIATIRTDLDPFSQPEQWVLINHGYSLAVAAIASYLSEWDAPAAPPKWPNLQYSPEGDLVALRHELRNSRKRKIFGVPV